MKFKKKFLSEKPIKRVALTIKDMKIKDGLSNRICNETMEVDGTEEVYPYVLKGPMGTGLDLLPTGVHIAFAAGTGILPFLDLVAYMIRLNLGQIKEYQKTDEENENFP